ncbi:hypothetical protein D6D17_03641 [Aureobasidium pullulans]|nr:hypothetical protein D6D17_03641 [Aureobasidium pullulans]
MTVWSDSFLLSISQATRASSDFCITMENFDVAIIFGLVFCILVIHHDDLNKSAAFITKHLACLYRLLFNAFGHVLSASQRFAVQMSTTVKESIVLPVCHSATELAHAVHVYLEELLKMIVLPTYYRAIDLVKSGRDYVVGLAITAHDRAVDLLHNINNYFQELREDDERLHNIFTVLSHAMFAAIILSSLYQWISLSGRLSDGALRVLFAAHLIFSHCMVGFIYASASVTELICSRMPSIVDSILEYTFWKPPSHHPPTQSLPARMTTSLMPESKLPPVAQNTLHDPLVCFDSSSTSATPAVHATDADDLNRLYGDMEVSYGEGIECNDRDNHDDCSDAVLSN